MTTTSSQSAEIKAANNRWSRLIKRTLLVLLGLAVLLFVAHELCRFAWFQEYRQAWGKDYDRERYTQIRKAIDADPQHLEGKSLDEVTEEFGLGCVPWDNVTLQDPGEARIYHFRGFTLHVTLAFLPPEILSQIPELSRATDPNRHGVLCTWAYVRIDGISDPKERMLKWREEVDEECRRINEEMRNRR
jgi:hypothetical protein